MWSFGQGQKTYRRGGFYIRLRYLPEAARAHIECAPTTAAHFKRCASAAFHLVFYLLSFIIYKKDYTYALPHFR